MTTIFGISKDNLEEFILKNGVGTEETRRAVYEKWFKKSPRYLFQEIDRRYDLRHKKICDVGCSYGMNLMYCRPDSYGIEILPECAAFAEALGLTVYTRDVVNTDLADLPKAEAVWCCAMLEHVDSPHIVLRKLWTLLEKDGLVFLWVPTIPFIPWRFFKRIPFLTPHLTAHTHSDHVNAFTPATIRFMAERAGFETVEVSAMYPWPLSILNRFLYVLDGAMYVGRKKNASVYFGNSTRKGKARYFDE